MMNTYEIRLLDANGTEQQRGFGYGNSAMEAAESSIAHGEIHLREPSYVVAINSVTGVAFKFEMTRAF